MIGPLGIGVKPRVSVSFLIHSLSYHIPPPSAPCRTERRISKVSLATTTRHTTSSSSSHLGAEGSGDAQGQVTPVDFRFRLWGKP